MWWTCDVQSFRTRLRLKIWARSETEARSKVERMYLAFTIRTLAPADRHAAFACGTSYPSPLQSGAGLEGK